MNPIKFTSKKGNTYCTVKSKMGQELNIREAQAINDGRVGGFLRFQVIPGGRSFRLIYDLNGLVSLTDFLQMVVLSKKMFACLLRNLSTVVKEADARFFSRDLYQFRIDQVMIDPVSWFVYFLYVPIQPFTAVGELKDVLQDIIGYATFDPSEDTSYVQEYIQILNSGASYSAYALEQFIHSLEEAAKKDIVCEERPAEAYIDSPVRRREQDEYRDTESRKNAGKPLDSGIIYRPEAAESDMFSEPEIQASAPELRVSEDDSGIVTVFRASNNKTLPKEKTPEYAHVFLQHVGSGERIRIDANLLIGKSTDSDFRIEKSTVSRRHAMIRLEADGVYLSDLGSTNGTYVNDQPLQKDRPVKLKHKDRVRFADEDFFIIILT